MMKRLGILMLTLVMCVAVLPYAGAEYTRASFYEMGLTALENIDAATTALAADWL